MNYVLALLLCATMCGWAWASEAEAGSSPFAGTVYQSVAAILVFVILAVALKKYAWGPILKGLQDREAKIKHDLERAEQAARQAENTLQEYQTRLSFAHDEAKKIIEKSRHDAQTIANNLKEQTQKDLDQLRQRCQADIQAAKEQAVRDIYTYTADLATAVAQRILQRQINEDDLQRLIDDSLTQATRGQN